MAYNNLDANTPYAYWVNSFYTGPIIYYVIDSRSGRGYVGQSRRGLIRLAEHIIGAYSDPAYKSGAATIIRSNTCRNTFFRYFTAANYYGIPNTIKYFLGIKKNPNQLGHWEYRKDSGGAVDNNQLNSEQLLDIAEVIHIIYNHQHGFNLSSENIKGGGQQRFKLYYAFSDYEIARICTILNSLGVKMSPSTLNTKINKYNITSQDLAKNTLKVTDPVSDVLIKELFEQDILSQIVQSDDFMQELIKACYGNTATFIAFLRKNNKNHKQAMSTVSSNLNKWLKEKLQQISEQIIYKLGNYNIDIQLSMEADFDYDSLLKTITNALSVAVKGKVFAGKTIEEALNKAFKTQQDTFRKVKIHIAHKFYANLQVRSSSTDAPWLKEMEQDWALRHQYAVDVQNSTAFADWIKAMSFCGFYQNYAAVVDTGPMSDYTDTLMYKIKTKFNQCDVKWGWSYEPYYRSNITLLQNIYKNPLEFDFDWPEIETAFAFHGGDLAFVHAWPRNFTRTWLNYYTSEPGEETGLTEEASAREYLFFEETAHIIQRLQDEMARVKDLKYY